MSPGSEPAHAGPAEVPDSRLLGMSANTKPEAGARAGMEKLAVDGGYQPPTIEDDSGDPGTEATGSESSLSSPSGVMSAGIASETSRSPPSTIPTSPEPEAANRGTFENKDAAAGMVEVSQLPTFLPSKDPGEPIVVVNEIPSPDAFETTDFPDESDGEEDTSHLDSFDDVEFAAQYQDEEGIDSPFVQATEEGEIGDAMLDDLGDAEVELGLGSSPTRRRDSLKAQQDVMEVIEEVDEEAVLREEEIAEKRERGLGTSGARGARGDWWEEKFVEDGDEGEEVEHAEHVENTGNVDRDDVDNPQSGSDESFHILRPERTYRIDALSGSNRGVDAAEAHSSAHLRQPLPSSSPAARDIHGGQSPLQPPFDPGEDDAMSPYPEHHYAMTMPIAELQTWLRTDQPPGLPQEDLQSWLTGGHLCGPRGGAVSQLPFNPFRSKSASASRAEAGELKQWEYKFGEKRDARTPVTWQHWDVVLPDEMTGEQRMQDRKGKGAQRDTPRDLEDSDSDEWELMLDDDDDKFGYPLKQFPRRPTPTAPAGRFQAQAESYGYRLDRISSKARSRSPGDDITLRARSLCPAPTGSSSPPPFGRRSSFEILQGLDEDKALTSPFTEINVVVDNRAPLQPFQTQPFSNIGKFPFVQHDNPTITPHPADSDSTSSSASIITVIGPNTPAGAAWMQFYAFLGTRQRALLGNRAKTRSIYYGGLWHGFWLEKKGAFDYFPSKDWEWTEPLRRWRRGGVVEGRKRPAIIIRPKEGEEKVLVGKEGRKKVVVEVEGGREVMVLERGVKIEGDVMVVKRDVDVDVLIPVEMCKEID